MIHTPRPPESAKLKANQVQWTVRWKKKPKEWATATARQVIKDALRPMTHAQCASNLFASCAKCNGTKGSLDHHGKLIKPDVDDPERLLWVHPDGGLEPYPGLSGPDLERAVNTIRAYGLQRGPLRTKRYEAFKAAGHWMLHAIDDQEQQEVFLNSSREFKLVVRQRLAEIERDDLAGEDRTRFERRQAA